MVMKNSSFHEAKYKRSPPIKAMSKILLKKYFERELFK